MSELSSEKLYRWQKAQFTVDAIDQHGPAAASDAARTLVWLASYENDSLDDRRQHQQQEADLFLAERANALAAYAAVMDSPDPAQGLNSFASIATALAAKHSQVTLRAAKASVSLKDVEAAMGVRLRLPPASFFALPARSPAATIPEPSVPMPAPMDRSGSGGVGLGRSEPPSLFARSYGGTPVGNGSRMQEDDSFSRSASGGGGGAYPPNDPSPWSQQRGAGSTAGRGAFSRGGSAATLRSNSSVSPQPFNPNDRSENEDDNALSSMSEFVTAKDQLIINNQIRRGVAGSGNHGGGGSSFGGRGGASVVKRGGPGSGGAGSSAGPVSVSAQDQAFNNSIASNYNLGGSNGSNNNNNNNNNNNSARKSLGGRRTPGSKFVSPMNKRDEGGQMHRPGGGGSSGPEDDMGLVDERLKNIDPKMIELITNEIMDHGPPIVWDDIAGLEFAKKTIMEVVVWPMMRPDIFKGLLVPPKGLLLFGPPGTGKTLIGKCIASQSGATFFSISASSLTSKWVGEGEKMVRALFAVARVHQPAVIFIDEIDSLLSQRSDGEHEASRRIKTEFLIQLDGATSGSDEDRLLVVGATNRPQEIDEAARRRLVKKLYIPLPEKAARRQIIRNLMSKQHNALTEEDIDRICDRSEGYSGADMSNLCKEAALGPVRSVKDITTITPENMRPVGYDDFDHAFRGVRASVSQKDLDLYLQWDSQYGSRGL